MVVATLPQPSRGSGGHGGSGVGGATLGEDWSPQQIAGSLVRTFPDEPEMWVSHETIYLTLFLQARGALEPWADPQTWNDLALGKDPAAE